MSQKLDNKLDTFLTSILKKIKILEYQGCTCGIDKQEIYEELWQLLHDMYRYYNEMRQAIVIRRCSFDDCLSPTAAVIEKRQYDTNLFSWLKRMYDQMNQLESEDWSMYIDGDICLLCGY